MMTLNEMAHAIFEIMRGGHVVDDERFDDRLMEDLIVVKRLEYLEGIRQNSSSQKSGTSGGATSRGGNLSDNNAQRLEVPLMLRETDGFLQSINDIPRILSRKGNLEIHEVAAPAHYDTYTFQYNPLQRWRFSGNGKYTQNIVYVTKHFDSLYVKSGNTAFRLLEKVILDAVFEDPRDVDGYDENKPFPIDGQGFEYIKDEILKRDITPFVRANNDEFNDADGEVQA